MIFVLRFFFFFWRYGRYGMDEQAGRREGREAGRQGTGWLLARHE